MAKKKKYYVVWKGYKPGIYDNWEETFKQVKGFPGAEYKAFPSLPIAKAAFGKSYEQARGDKSSALLQDALFEMDGPILDSYCVDAACSGNPGVLEYRGVYLQTGQIVFQRGPFENGTNNVGEFLAIVHVLSLLTKMGMKQPVYSDSEIAIGWVKQKSCKTKLQPDDKNQELFELISRAEVWLAENDYPNQLLKWDTEVWGEIPADFGRK